MQSKKTKLQSSTFSLPYSVQLKISSKIKLNKSKVFAYFPKIREKFDGFKDNEENRELL